MDAAEYDRHDATALAELIRTGEIAAGEVVGAGIERIEHLDPSLRAVVTTTFDRARARLAAGVGEGPFAGVPFLLKDLGAELEGIRQTQGSRSSERWVPDFTSTLGRRFEDAGFVVLGRTNTPEFGFAPVTEPEATGVTENPWRIGYTAGGSSGGSAAAVAAGIVPAAHASDGGGSIRIPASQCGLFGLKPTRGRTPSGPIEGESWFGMSVGHVVSRSVRDSAAILDAIAGPESGDPYAAPALPGPLADQVGVDPGSLRIGLVEGGVFHDEIHPECRAAVEDAAALAESLGHRVEVIDLPVNRETWSEAFLIAAAAAAANVVDLTARRAGLDKPDADAFELETWVLSLVGRKLSAARLGEALALIRSVGRTVGRVMESHDVLLLSTLARPPFPHGELKPSSMEVRLLEILKRFPATPALMAAFGQLAGKVMDPIPNTPLFNMTGQPAMSVPLHWTSDGLPVGVQFAGRFGDETTLYRLAAQLEEARPWFHRRPPIAAGSESSNVRR
jgi:amidase